MKLKLLLFTCIVLSITIHSCSTERSEIDRARVYAMEHTKSFLSLASWINSLNIDTSFVVEYRARARKVLFYYLTPNGQRESYFAVKTNVPDSLIEIFDGANLSIIIKQKLRSYYRYVLGGHFYGKAEALVYVPTLSSSDLNNFTNLAKAYNGVYNQKWLFVANTNTVFASESVVDSLSNEH